MEQEGATSPAYLMLKITIPFYGHGYNMPNVGELIDPPEPIRAALLDMGVVEVYETKVVSVPEQGGEFLQTPTSIADLFPDSPSASRLVNVSQHLVLKQKKDLSGLDIKI